MFGSQLEETNGEGGNKSPCTRLLNFEIGFVKSVKNVEGKQSPELLWCRSSDCLGRGGVIFKSHDALKGFF